MTAKHGNVAPINPVTERTPRRKMPLGRIHRRIADQIQKARIGKGMTQDELGARCGISQERVSHYERCYDPVLHDVLYRMAVALEVLICKLYGQSHK